MIAEFGHFSLLVALGMAVVQASVPIYGLRKNDPVLMAVAGPAALAQFCFVAIAFAALTICYVRSDFSVLNAFENSHSFHEPTWMARTTNGAAADPTWESRPIFDPGAHSATISTTGMGRSRMDGV